MQVTAGVEGDTGGQRCVEEFRRCRSRVLAAGIDWLVDRQDAVADSDRKLVACAVADPDHGGGVACRLLRRVLVPQPA